MTITMEIHLDNGLIIRRGIGHISMDEILLANEDTHRHPGFQPDMDAIWDLRQADVGHFSTEDLKILSQFIARQSSWRGSHYKLAVVAPREIDFIVASTFSIIAQIDELSIAVQVFRDYEQGLSWSLCHQDRKLAPMYRVG